MHMKIQQASKKKKSSDYVKILTKKNEKNVFVLTSQQVCKLRQESDWPGPVCTCQAESNVHQNRYKYAVSKSRISLTFEINLI